MAGLAFRLDQEVFEGFKGIALLFNGMNGDESGIVINECDKISVPLVGYGLDLTDIGEDLSKGFIGMGRVSFGTIDQV